MAIPADVETRLTRQQTAAALTEAGFPVSTATLTTKATRGGGPPFSHFGPRVLYRWGDAFSGMGGGSANSPSRHDIRTFGSNSLRINTSGDADLAWTVLKLLEAAG